MFPHPLAPIFLSITSTYYLWHIISTLFDAFFVGIKPNIFWVFLRRLLTSICFRARLGFDSLILVLSLENFLSTFVKMADSWGIKNSTDIILLADNFSLMRLCQSSTMFSLFISQFMAFVHLWEGPLLKILRRFSFLIICKYSITICPWI